MSDKTYAESNGIPAFDWNDALDHPGEFIDLHLKSRDWVTCACGNQCAIIPRHKEAMGFQQRGEPKDDSLSDLGCEFHECVLESDYTKAKMILGQIEAHSAILIAQELAKLNAEPIHA